MTHILGTSKLNEITLRESSARSLAWCPDRPLVLPIPWRAAKLDIWNYDFSPARIESTISTSAPVKFASWSPDGSLLAICDKNGIAILDSKTWSKLLVLGDFRLHSIGITWSPDSRSIASISQDQLVWVWSARTGQVRKRLESPNLTEQTCISWSPNERFLATGTIDGRVFLHDIVEGSVEVLDLHSGAVLTLAWAPNGNELASGGEDHIVNTWNAQTRIVNVLEGHVHEVGSVGYSPDGELLWSASLNEDLIAWRTDTQEQVLRNPSRRATRRDISFPIHPIKPLLAQTGPHISTMVLLSYDAHYLLGSVTTEHTYYRNAKVVLLGDSGVGKSGLGLVLAGQDFTPTESTHARRVWSFHAGEIPHGQSHEMREILLWDLAGQPGYRLIHQLHLSEVVIALIVFDAKSELDPLSGIRYWGRALKQAFRVQPSQVPMTSFLVAARTDRGGVGLSRSRINSILEETGSSEFFETSAKEGQGIDDLTKAIHKSIRWELLPRVSSTALFDEIKAFLVTEKEQGVFISTAEDLFARFSDHHRGTMTDTEFSLRSQFDTCIGRVAARGLIRPLSFGNRVLLQPELLDAYASALVNAAKDEPDGLGHIAEKTALAGEFRIPSAERTLDSAQEQLLLISTVEELLKHEIVFRERVEDGDYLVFPSQSTRERTDLPEPEGKAVVFIFSGPVLSIYATLIVRLSHSGAYSKRQLWKNAARFVPSDGGGCGVFVREVEEGIGDLTTFYDKTTTKESRSRFDDYIRFHLMRRALEGSVRRAVAVICGTCDTPVSELQVRRRRQRNYEWISCPVCDSKVQLQSETRAEERFDMAATRHMNEAADAKRDSETAAVVLEGKKITSDFDVFLAHNSFDKSSVVALANQLRGRGLNPWLDDEQVQPGRWFQDVIQDVVKRVRSVAIIIGQTGLGKWQKLELRSFISQCVENDIPVIPVLLPGVQMLPEELFFLKELNWVRFTNRITEKVILDRLEWGITGKRPAALVPKSRS
jgi:WD40 repeat protein